MKDYLTFREEENGELKYYILQRAFPHMIGVVTDLPLIKSLSYSPIAGYNMYVNFHSTLSNAIPSYKNIIEEINIVISEMATWFLVNRIIGNEKRFDKFKIQ